MLPVASLLTLASCAVQSDDYHTPPPYGADTAAEAEPANPVYDSPAAYEHDSTAPAVAHADPGLPADPGAPPQATAIPAQNEQHTAVSPSPMAGTRQIIHTVAKGDTLSGMSRKYGVTMDAIRAANGMTGDTVILGRKMIIPGR